LPVVYTNRPTALNWRKSGRKSRIRRDRKRAVALIVEAFRRRLAYEARDKFLVEPEVMRLWRSRQRQVKERQEREKVAIALEREKEARAKEAAELERLEEIRRLAEWVGTQLPIDEYINSNQTRSVFEAPSVFQAGSDSHAISTSGKTAEQWAQDEHTKKVASGSKVVKDKCKVCFLRKCECKGDVKKSKGKKKL